MEAVTLHLVGDKFPWCQILPFQNGWENRQPLATGLRALFGATIQLLQPHVSSSSIQPQPQLLVLFQDVYLWVSVNKG